MEFLACKQFVVVVVVQMNEHTGETKMQNEVLNCVIDIAMERIK